LCDLAVHALILQHQKLSVFEGVAELSVEQNVWTEMEEVIGVWRKLRYEERISSVHQRTVSMHSP
jgi:hypothetical protein